MSDVKCPHCGELLDLELVAKLAAFSSMKFRMEPKPGEYLSTHTVGGYIEQVGKLLEAVGNEIGVKTHVAVERILTEEGAITIDLLITRLDAPKEAEIERLRKSLQEVKYFLQAYEFSDTEFGRLQRQIRERLLAVLDDCGPLPPGIDR